MDSQDGVEEGSMDDSLEDLDDEMTMAQPQEGLRKGCLARRSSDQQEIAHKKRPFGSLMSSVLLFMLLSLILSGCFCTGSDFIHIVVMMQANVICWNCRGLSSSATLHRIKKLIKDHNPQMVALVETRAKEPRILRFCKRFRRIWSWAAIHSQGFSGGIILLWRKNLILATPVVIAQSALRLVISSNPVGVWILSVIYNGQAIETQRGLWREISCLSSLNLPHLIMGDFNAIRFENAHKGEIFFTISEKLIFFNNFIAKNALLNLHYAGPDFTRCNGRSGNASMFARLDRCLANTSWFSYFGFYIVFHFARISSDQAPLLLSVKLKNAPTHRTFRFKIFWLNYPDCLVAVDWVLIFLPIPNPFTPSPISSVELVIFFSIGERLVRLPWIETC